MGDPDGCIRYRGLYHLFWWGHAISTDLVRWRELDWPMLGDDGSFAYFTGSVVVDERNTGGWGGGGDPAMVAVYTAHRHADGLQNQRISISTNGATFQYWHGNPVLDQNSKAFRDPDVFWYAPGGRWIMVVALADERKFRFYDSADLKTWRFISDFGPLGAVGGVWEVPHFFRIPVENDPGQVKWVLLGSVSPNKMQYFVGDFDGTRFTPNPAGTDRLKQGPGPDGEVLFDFERADENWQVAGSAFGEGPVQGALPRQNLVTGYTGLGYVNSFHGGDKTEGTLRSPPFTITRDYLNFQIGGGAHPGETGVNLEVGGRVVRSATGRNSESLLWTSWDVREWKGQEARIRIVDRKTGGWGHILVDHIMLSEAPVPAEERESACWLDWGPDFYAGRVFRDYDDPAAAKVMIGWMGNWEYANKVPTSWGRGAQSIPRELTLVSSPRGYELIQRPLPALQKLRGPAVALGARQIGNAAPLEEFRPARNTYELEAVFGLGAEGRRFGLNLCVRGLNKVAIGYDVAEGRVFLDRRKSGDVSFSDVFAREFTAPLVARGDEIKFHVFVDQSSVEVFVNDGQAVLTAQIFPDPRSTGVELFSTGGEIYLKRFTAWELASIW